MKILFTADLHIKLGQKSVPVDWQKARFRSLFKQLASTYKTYNCDYLIIGGDVFDRLATLEELSLYFELLDIVKQNKLYTYIYSGNHEAVKKTTTFLSSLAEITSTATDSYATILDDYACIDDLIDVIPYNKLKTFESNVASFPTSTRKLLCTHVRGEIPPHVKPEVDLSIFDGWQLVLAGDLHSYKNSQRNILYPGSPVSTSFHRSETENGVLVVDTETLAHEFVVLNLPQLIRKTVSSEAEMVQTEFHHTIYELTGDISTVNVKVTSELLDKKIIRKTSRSALEFSETMSMRDELVLYLDKVLTLEPAKIEKIIQLYDDNIKNTELE